MRDFRKPELFSDDMLKHLAMIAHCCYGSVDLALHCLLALADRGVVSGDIDRRYLFE